MALRDIKSFEDYNYQEVEQTNQETYSEYVPDHQQSFQVEELFFFLNVTVFCLLTVLFSFLFLSLNWHAFLALSSAAIASLLSVLSYRLVTKTNHKK